MTTLESDTQTHPLADGEIDTSLEPETLTEKTPTKTVACRKCHRACIVTLFATPSKTECSTCRGKNKAEHKEKVQVNKAHTVDPATLENLLDGLVNPAFKIIPLCPFDPEHSMTLKNISHSPNYGPRRLVGHKANGMPVYEQDTGESVVYQCHECQTVVSFSTMHPLPLLPQNAPRTVAKDGPGILELSLGTEQPDDL